MFRSFKTCGEFWSLVYDHECSAVVVLCQPPHNSVSLTLKASNKMRSLQVFDQKKVERNIAFYSIHFKVVHYLIASFLFRSANLSCILARGPALEKIWTSIHHWSHFTQSLLEYKNLDISNQQESYFPHRADGWR